MSALDDAIAADAPLYWWPLDDAGGSQPRNDGSLGAAGNGQMFGTQGTTWNFGAASIVPYDPGPALSVTGVNGGGVRSATGGSQFNQAAFTVETWVRPTTWGTDNPVIFAVDQDGNPGALRWRAYVKTTGVFEIVYRDAANTAIAVTNTGEPLVAGPAYHLALTWSSTANAFQLYVNGVAHGAPMATASLAATTSAYLELGFIFGGGISSSVQGRHQHFAYYDKVLTAARILAHYNAGTGGPATRFYLPGRGGLAWPLDVPMPAAWLNSAEIVPMWPSPMVLEKDGRALFELGGDPGAGTGKTQRLVERYSYKLGAAVTIAGTVTLCAAARQTDGTRDASLQLRVRLVAADGRTALGELYAGVATTAEAGGATLTGAAAQSGSTVRYLTGTLTSTAAPAGAYLVVEVGVRQAYAGSIGNRFSTMTVGSPTADDQPRVNGSATPALTPWVEFSATIPPSPPEQLVPVVSCTVPVLIDGDPMTSASGTTAYLADFTLAAPTKVTAYRMKGDNNASKLPMDWTLKGSNDGGATWTVVDTVTGAGAPATLAGWRNYDVDTPGAYSLYRFDSTMHNGQSPSTLAEFQLVKVASTGPGHTFYLGNTRVDKLMLGNTQVDKVYLGNTQIT